MPTQKINSPEQVNDLTGGISTGTLDARYLKLDASNDPITGFLEIKPTSNGVRGLNIETMGDTSSFEVTQRATGSVGVGSSVFTLIREPSGDSAPTFSEPMMNLTQSRGSSGTISGGLLKYNSDATERVGINPSIQGTGTIAFIDGDFTLSPDGKLLLLKNHGTTKFYVNASGTAYSNDSPLIKEAPTDGRYYARKSAGWEETTPVNGWIPQTNTWIRTGNHTIITSGNLTGTYQAGTKVWYLDNGIGNKYGVVGSNSFTSGSVTTLNLIPNTDFIASGTISNPNISYIEEPVGWPDIFNYTSAVASSVGSITSYSFLYARWKTIAKQIKMDVGFDITNNGTGSGQINVDTPITIAQSANGTGREGGITGNQLQVLCDAASAIAKLFFYNNTYPGGTNYRLQFQIIFGF